MGKTLKSILAVLVLGVGLKVGLENIGPVKNDCEIYQGHHINAPDEETVYVFDPQSLDKRNGSPKYIIRGNPKLKDSLMIGKKYCFELKDSIAPWAPRKLISIHQPINQDTQRR